MDVDGCEVIDLTMLSSNSEEVQLEDIPPFVPNDSLLDFESDGMESRSREEENEIFLRIRLDENLGAYTPADFKAARPKNDPSGPVTLESLFDHVAETLRTSRGRIPYLHAIFWERYHLDLRPYDKGKDTEVQPLMLTQCNIRSWKAFMFHLRKYVDKHQDVARHIAILPYCI